MIDLIANTIIAIGAIIFIVEILGSFIRWIIDLFEEKEYPLAIIMLSMAMMVIGLAIKMIIIFNEISSIK